MSIFNVYLMLPAFLLVLFRIGGLMLAAPFFSGAAIPVRFRILFTVAAALAVFPLAAAHLTMPVTLSTALTGLIGELVLGLFVGFAVSLTFMAFQLAADVISHQSGMLLGTVFNPMLDNAESIVSQLYYFAAMMAFFALGGHRALIRALLDSFTTIPPLGFKMSEGLMASLLDLLTVSFELTIRISGPTVAALMLALLTLGFISRTVPQLNILTVGFPLKLGLALFVMSLTMMSMETVLVDSFQGGIDSIREALRLPR